MASGHESPTEPEGAQDDGEPEDEPTADADALATQSILRVRAAPEAAAVESRVAAAALGGAEVFRLHGEANIRGSKRPPLSSLHEGRFGRMFRRVEPLAPLGEERLRALADSMRDEDPPTGWNGQVQEDRDNPRIPAGYTYLGQFIDHDITFDPTSSLQRRNDPDALVDFRSPRYDLDSLYGSGPIDEPFQYERQSRGLRLLYNREHSDLARNVDEFALIGDPRNDENTIVSQLHLLFVRLHEKFSEVVESRGTRADEQFNEIQRLVRWHYQWVVAHDYVRLVAGEKVFRDLCRVGRRTGYILEIKRKFFRVTKNAYMPIEFSVAGFRFGHSQVRGIYNLNDNVVNRHIFMPGPLPDDPNLHDLRGFRKPPAGWAARWDLFFEIGGSVPQPSRKIDTRLVPQLFELPDGAGSLPLRNLLRGEALGLPSGQAIARFVGVDELDPTTLQPAPVPTPLWFYILREADVMSNGRHLGPVGARIVGEVLLGLLELDPQSWYSVDRTWTPEREGIIPIADRASDVQESVDRPHIKGLRMADLVAFVSG